MYVMKEVTKALSPELEKIESKKPREAKADYYRPVPHIKLLLNLRQGQSVSQSTGPISIDTDVVTIPAMIPAWKAFLWGDGEKSFETLSNLLCTDKAEICAREGRGVLTNVLDDVDQWGRRTCTMDHPLISSLRDSQSLE